MTARAAALALSLCLANAAAGERTEPTPYPARGADWPGSGVIRVFGWMEQHRLQFWRERKLARRSVVFVGDSLVANWRTLSDDFPGLNVSNRGIGGDVSRGLLFRFDEDVLALQPKAIVLLIGTNDLTARQAAADTIANIDRMLRLRRDRRVDAPVLLCAVPPSANPQAPVDARERERLNRGLLALARRHEGVIVVDLFGALGDTTGAPDPRYFKPDLLHLSAEGYARWKAVLGPALAQAGIAGEPLR